MPYVKYNYQNISAEVSRESVVIKNKHLFVNTSQYRCYVYLLRDGIQIEKAMIYTDVPPLTEKMYPLPLQKHTLPGEYTIIVSFELREPTNWGAIGHEIAFGQYVYHIQKTVCPCTRPFTITEGTNNIGIRGDDFEILFSQLLGGITSYVYAGKEMIKAVPKPNFWRAPVDNDYGNNMPGRYAQWKIASMYLTHKTERENGMWDCPRLQVTRKENCAEISFVYHLPTVPASTCEVVYQVYGDGSVNVKMYYDPVPGLTDMPEFGMLFKLDADYEYLEWYGNGPQETYKDRKLGSKLGIYKNRIADNMARYIVPQECGNKTDVRYAKVMDLYGRGMIFSGDNMNFSALPYTPHEIENATHPFELPQAHYTVVRVALDQMGVAGDDSWGARTKPEHLIDVSKRVCFGFSFKGI